MKKKSKKKRMIRERKRKEILNPIRNDCDFRLVFYIFFFFEKEFLIFYIFFFVVSKIKQHKDNFRKSFQNQGRICSGLSEYLKKILYKRYQFSLFSPFN